MPEGPEARRITDKLRSRIKGKILLSLSWFDLPKSPKYSNYLGHVWPQVERLFPSPCLDILCRGKQIFYFFENGIAFISSLGTEGHWYYFKAGQDHNYLKSKNYAKFSLTFGTIQTYDNLTLLVAEDILWYDDMLNYGNFTVTIWQGAFDKMKEIGPDLLSTVYPLQEIHPKVKERLPPEFTTPVTLKRFANEIKSPRRSQMELCRFLMEPKYISGVGNYLKSEILYRAQLHPNRVLGSLTDKEIETLLQVALKTISEAYQHGGLTHGTFLDPDMRKGTFPVFVYKRAGTLDPNGYPIRSIKTKDGRTSYFVAEIQK